MQKYQILGAIGEGAYGVVLQCRHIETKEIVAIKKFKESEEDQSVKKTTVREVKVLKVLEHNNIVKLKEAFRKKGIVYLVFEYVNNNLLQLLEKQQTGLQPELIKQIIYQTVKGIAYLHSLNFVHRDIKPENLLVSDKMIVKICDFGFARTIKAGDSNLTDYVATRWYRAPQLLVGDSYSKQVDMWAIGCIFGQLIDGNPIFPGQNQLDQLFLIQKCLGSLTANHQQIFLKNQRFLGMKFPEITSLDTIQKRYLGKINQKGLHFIKSLLKMEPIERLTAVDALKHPYFDGIREDDDLKRLFHPVNNNRVISACQTVYQKNNRHSVNNDADEERDIFPSHDITRNKVQIKRKEETSRSSNFKTNLTNQHSKSTNKNTVNIKKPKDNTLSLQRHHNRDMLVKTQAGFFITPTQQQTYGRNKIYGGGNTKSKSKSRQGNRKSKNQNNQGSSVTTGFPYLIIGNSKKNDKTHEKMNNVNIIINNNTWINATQKQY